MNKTLSYVLPEIVWSTAFHLETKDGLSIYTSLRDNQVWIIKGKAGFPWDMHTIGEDVIRQSITEYSWTDAAQFKMFASKSEPASANGGIAWLPLEFEDIGTLLLTPDTTYRTYTACGKFTESNLGSPAYVNVRLQANYDFGGDLGTRDCLRQDYYWGTTCEVNRYAKGYGLSQWERYLWQSGEWVFQQVSAFNLIRAGGTPKLVFPCGVPTI